MGEKTVLLVDDDPGVRASLSTTLRLVDIRTREADSGEQALQMIRENPPDLVVLDIRMPPGMDGFETFRELRGFSRTPVIFLSEDYSLENQMTGIEMGAWDYVGKGEFEPAILSRKIDNLLESTAEDRRTAGEADNLHVGRLRYNASGRFFEWDAERFEPTETETRILEALMRHPGQVFSRDQLQDVIGPGVFVQPKTIDSHVKGLRKRFKRLGIQKGTIIKTRPGFGYQLGACQ